MKTLHVTLGERSYPIIIDRGLLGRSEQLLPYLKQPRVAIVTNETIAPLMLRDFSDALRAAGVQVVEIIVPDGEKYKTWETLNSIFDVLLQARCERSTTLIALGGGVIGDMTGFAAACYQRGAPFIQVPTTLLSLVDSSVGGKTAINHPSGKNMIGAFYQPRLVLADIQTLDTLSDRELRSGLVEVIKYGLIRDADFLAWLEDNLPRLLAREPEALEYAVFTSCRHKADVVAADEHENGERALLNLGHTFGHAIETGQGYGNWLHGEAVAVGTLMAAELSRRLGWLNTTDVSRIEHLFIRAGIPVSGPAMDAERYLALMSHDKKVIDGKLRLILLQRLGAALICDTATPTDIVAAIVARSP